MAFPYFGGAYGSLAPKGTGGCFFMLSLNWAIRPRMSWRTQPLVSTNQRWHERVKNPGLLGQSRVRRLARFLGPTAWNRGVPCAGGMSWEFGRIQRCLCNRQH